MRFSELRYLVKGAVMRLRLDVHDAWQNRRHVQSDQRILVVRHAAKNPYFYDVLLTWLEEHYPQVRSLFELRALPCRVDDWSRYVLHVPWLQDPVQKWSPRAYEQALQLAGGCDEHRIPIINRVDRLLNAAKSCGAEIIGSVGLRTPRMVRIKNVEEFRETRLGLDFPLFVREDWGHGGLVCRADEPADVRRIPLHRFVHPVAVEFIDVQSRHDGLYRKYRFVTAGDISVPHSLHACRGWNAKGTHAEYSDALRDEELFYTNHPDPNADLLQSAREALGLDFVAFDYSYDGEGRPVVWEANPYPHIHFNGGRRQYRSSATVRTLAAMADLYLRRAGLAVPMGIERLANPADMGLSPIIAK